MRAAGSRRLWRAGVAVPEAMRGAWVRVGFSVEGRAAPSPARVLWVQAASAYADLRVPAVPGGEVVCFAGTTDWDGERLTWRHVLDRTGWEGPDVAVASWRGSDLVESGEMVVDGRRCPYEEVWRRVGAGSTDGLLALDGETDDGALAGMVVAAGGHAVVLADLRPAGDFVAASWRQPRRGVPWAALDLVGGAAADALPTPPAQAGLPAASSSASTPRATTASTSSTSPTTRRCAPPIGCRSSG